uniref:CASP-like protein n=1 Tax=Rhizophora mucronata TaxID=61149 RepID=A0A2P2LNK9_RHIMU
MNVSHASVHPVEDPPTTEAAAGNNQNNNPPRVRMKDIQGMPGTQGGFVLRVCQFVFAAVALAVMATTSDFPSVTAFRYNTSLNFVNYVAEFSFAWFGYWVTRKM